MELVSNNICRKRVTSTDFVSPPFASLLSEVPKNTKTQSSSELLLKTINSRLGARWVSGLGWELHRSLLRCGSISKTWSDKSMSNKSTQ